MDCFISEMCYLTYLPILILSGIALATMTLLALHTYICPESQPLEEILRVGSVLLFTNCFSKYSLIEGFC